MQAALFLVEAGSGVSCDLLRFHADNAVPVCTCVSRGRAKDSQCASVARSSTAGQSHVPLLLHHVGMWCVRAFPPCSHHSPEAPREHRVSLEYKAGFGVGHGCTFAHTLGPVHTRTPSVPRSVAHHNGLLFLFPLWPLLPAFDSTMTAVVPAVCSPCPRPPLSTCGLRPQMASVAKAPGLGWGMGARLRIRSVLCTHGFPLYLAQSLTTTH